MKTCPTIGGRTAYFNEKLIRIESCTPEKEVEIRFVLEQISSVERGLRLEIDNRQREHKHEKIIDLHRKHVDYILIEIKAGRLFLGPEWFITRKNKLRMTNKSVQQFAEGTQLGKSILQLPGLFAFIDDLATDDAKVSYRRALNRVVASLSNSIGGVNDVKEIPPELVEYWIQFHQNDTGTRWNDTFWDTTAQYSKRCIREVIFSFARATGHQKVTTRMKVMRSDANTQKYWSDIETSAKPHIQPWIRMYTLWRAKKPTSSRAYRQMMIYLLRWMSENFDPKLTADIATFLSIGDRSPSFTTWLIDLYSNSDKGGSGESYACYVSYAKRFSEFISQELVINNLEARQLHYFATDEDIDLIRNVFRRVGLNQRSHETKSRPLPMRMYRLVQEILEEGEEGWPGKVCREQVHLPNGKRQRIYCPVLPTLFLSLFHLPLRVGQMKRLDSGEGDTLCYNALTMTWCHNENRNAAYWKKQLVGYENRGYAYEFKDSIGERSITGFFINTNKTGAP